MKSSNWCYVLCFVLGGIAMVAAQNMLFVKATAQQPPGDLQATPPPPPRGIQFDGKTVTELHANGTIVERTPDGKILRTTQGKAPAQEGVGAYPVPSAGGHNFYAVGSPPDPEVAKLMNDEMQATQAAQKVLAELRAADSDGERQKLKAQLRENLMAIFDVQQKRRAAEVAKIEERLAKLKDTMKKRDTAKDTIVDRRLDVLTGGTDELGWEETYPLGGPNAANSFRNPNFVPYGVPNTLVVPQYGPPATTVPRPSNVPALPGPAALPPAAPAPGAAPSVVPRATTPVPSTPSTSPATR